MSFPVGADGKESASNAGDPGSIPRFGRSPGEGSGNPLQYCHSGIAILNSGKFLPEEFHGQKNLESPST